jgi:hypothetical protein
MILGSGERLFGIGSITATSKLVSAKKTVAGGVISVCRRAEGLQAGPSALD